MERGRQRPRAHAVSAEGLDCFEAIFVQETLTFAPALGQDRDCESGGLETRSKREPSEKGSRGRGGLERGRRGRGGLERGSRGEATLTHSIARRCIYIPYVYMYIDTVCIYVYRYRMYTLYIYIYTICIRCIYIYIPYVYIVYTVYIPYVYMYTLL